MKFICMLSVLMFGQNVLAVTWVEDAYLFGAPETRTFKITNYDHDTDVAYYQFTGLADDMVQLIVGFRTPETVRAQNIPAVALEQEFRRLLEADKTIPQDFIVTVLRRLGTDSASTK
ncbi:MAG: hypothetical protein V4534_01370 [Myxococcota bacterium]